MKYYRIVSKADLPLRFNGRYTYDEAFHIICDWNSWHGAEDMAQMIPMEEAA